MKRLMRRVVGERRLTFDEFDTFITAAEATLNARPLIEDTDDVGELILTPAHFLVGKLLIPLPRKICDHAKCSQATHWKLVVVLQENLRKAWNEFYIQQLMSRNKWKKSRKNLAVDDVVLLVDEGLHPHTWRRGRIIEARPGNYGRVRVVKLICIRPGGTSYETSRSVTKVCKLPSANLVGGLSATATQVSLMTAPSVPIRI